MSKLEVDIKPEKKRSWGSKIGWGLFILILSSAVVSQYQQDATNDAIKSAYEAAVKAGLPKPSDIEKQHDLQDDLFSPSVKYIHKYLYPSWSIEDCKIVATYFNKSPNDLKTAKLTKLQKIKIKEARCNPQAYHPKAELDVQSQEKKSMFSFSEDEMAAHNQTVQTEAESLAYLQSVIYKITK